MGFTTPCFIRKNTDNIRNRLKELGYYCNPYLGWHNLYVCDNMVYRECELDFLNVGNLVIDWEQRRYELAKDIIKAVIADDRGGNSDAIAKYAVNCADALIKRLKEVNNG